MNPTAHERMDDEEISASTSQRPRRYPPLETAKGAKKDWANIVCRAQEDLSDQKLTSFARALGVPSSSLRALFVGLMSIKKRPVYVFPELNAAGHIVGVATRTEAGEKGMLRHSKRGLYLPQGWSDGEGPILVPEGATDTATLSALQLSAVGRPSATGGIVSLARLFEDIPPGRTIIVLGEVDPKVDGRWPGCDGAEYVATELARRLGRPCQWTLPPDGAKDARDWLLGRVDDDEH